MQENQEETLPAAVAEHRFMRPLRSFVRRGGRLTAAQEHAMVDLAPEYLIDVPRDSGVTSIAVGSATDPQKWYPQSAPLTVEIGSGQGHQITHGAKQHPERNFLAVEVFVGGLARTMVLAAQQDVHNLRMIEANAPEVLEHLLPEASVAEVWIFFPDPWHKARHNKRRLISPSFMPVLARALQPGAVVRLATDWAEYAEQMREVFDAAPQFSRDFEGEWAPRFEGRVLTAFEQKGINAGREIFDLTYRKAAA
ncbi:tRNA (guanosine(46)-N7)-methyltransferase TrmB [Leucobacter sp. OH2974_COT-288]|nr:tRNA (guanosine(46)-N7)-methyltransferase TrmB [Leucobacter sp. OH2974_COT-288]